MSNISISKPEGTDGKAILGSDKNSSLNNLEKNALKDEYGSDGVHPNKKGYKVMSLLAEREINKILDQ